MNAAAAAPSPLRPVAAKAPAPAPFPSPAALALERSSWAELEHAFLRGTTPAFEALVGWEFRGINTAMMRLRNLPRVFGIKKFLKGFYRGPKVDAEGPAPAAENNGRVMGYNSPVAQNVLDGRWHVAPKRFGFYEVHAVDATARDNAYLHAVLLDYGRGGNKAYDPTRGLRDYLVQLGEDLFLGKAYYALGPVRMPTNFFILERHRVGLTDYARR